MTNKAMERKLQAGEALDVRKVGKEIEPGLYRLNGFISDVDYCDAEREEWIWSIGRHVETGEVLASTSTRFYGNPAYECLWLR